jgi:hypothetical protein
VYNDNDTTQSGGRMPVRNERNVDLNVVTPADRVRWGPILAGIFTALTTGLILSLLALALGLTAFDPNSTLRSFGIGAGIVSALLWLIAFGVGGYVASRTAAFPGRSNGVFNGLMVGLVGIPLILWGLSNIVGGLLGTAGSVASTVAQTAAPALGQAAADPEAQAAASDAAASAPAAASTAASAVASAAATVEQNSEEIANTARNTALASLAPLVGALGASAVGGAIGARKPEEDEINVRA